MAEPVTAIADTQTQKSIQQYRVEQITRQLNAADCAAIVLFDPVNIRYATGTRNMQVWTMHNICRYAVVFANGTVVLFDLPSSSHLSQDLVADIRPALTTDFMAVGHRAPEMGRRWAESMISLLREQGVAENRLAIDRADLTIVLSSQKATLDLQSGQPIMEQARSIKSVAEAEVLRASLRTCEQSVIEMREQLQRHGAQNGVRIAAGSWDLNDQIGNLLNTRITVGNQCHDRRLPRTNFLQIRHHLGI